jgi:hypothetical protein
MVPMIEALAEFVGMMPSDGLIEDTMWKSL